MQHFLEISLFWAAVFAAICLIARLPDSWPGRILFARQGPHPLRGEPRSRYLLRWAAYDASWFAQAIFVLLIGWEALSIDPSLAQALFFQVFCLAVVPFLATVALLSSLAALAASFWRRYLGAERRKRADARAIRA